MRIFKITWFARFAGKEGITDGELREAVNQLESGQADANLGGNVYKVRVARPGEGKSGGYRVIVVFRSGERTFYMYGFAKSERENISPKELRKLKKQAKSMLAMTSAQIADALKEGVLNEL
ncbi:MAG: type II toxin-antitoxin system RelE/ParE family toxin [Treponema sp.]|nr:type II toxin-antitoxin system RelE/ParE family toxin [Treponema sp.]